MIKHKKLTPTNHIQQRKGNIVSNMNGEMVMLSIHNGKYYNFGEIGGQIWRSINGTISIDSLVGTLMETYEIEEETCREQVLLFLEDLLTEQLIEVVKYD
ncbi:lasso peptide biosynthesis PqqD family chaperone [Rossellomorea vietnamensis]|uniref:Lasso peptide biosynthesis PqqD family chaperone n=1 Tax=Rossellomorea vietnamensis TaxID=218284 RepID=A0ACD4C573_9BACI|nr:lasso peptide biosynthesis PqqD family chaperone [Rossellomorea vietnamensis]UXH42747.1 lasso peptide biosynthesis PqqD family chaperone [Rossellomorea vietnamensis]